jgi:hypothetical protein
LAEQSRCRGGDAVKGRQELLVCSIGYYVFAWLALQGVRELQEV